MASKRVICAITSVILLFLFPDSGKAQLQYRVDARNLYSRIYAIVPFIGGTAANPRRPKYAPALAAAEMQTNANKESGPRSGILGWAMVESDDGKSALVEFVAADPSVFQDILKDAEAQTFQPGKNSAEEVEAAFKQRRKDFSFRHFGVRLP